MPPHAWNPETYLNFSAPRLRPALDLIDAVRRIDGLAPRRIVDLGCGPGGITRRLARMWPEAEVVGIDTDAAMLDKARDAGGDGKIAWLQSDIAAWAAAKGPEIDLVFSNAALQWVPDHSTIFSAIARRLAPGGVFAVQMPNNFARPSHTAIRAILREHWPDVERDYTQIQPPADAAHYIDWLEAAGCMVDSWQTDYLHILDGDDPVVAWTRGSTLGPVLAALPEPACQAFLELYAARLRAAYPPRPDGRTLFSFLRMFFLARRDMPDAGRV